METAKYNKKSLSLDEQITLLTDRGMVIADPSRAKHYLTHINYYRLRAYWLPFEDGATNGSHCFRPGTSFDDIIAIYAFDRELRMLVMDAIERFEISLRSCLAHYLAITYGPFAHIEEKYFSDYQMWKGCMEKLDKEFQGSKETFAKHYREKYKEIASPPIWVSCELFSLGNLSRWLKNLKSPKDRQAIADKYDIDEKVLTSFVHHLSIVRNHCAHHGRLWNRKFSFKMRIPAKRPLKIIGYFNKEKDCSRLFNTLMMLWHLIDVTSPNSLWASRIISLIKQCSQVSPADMGFPNGWENQYPWCKL